MPFAHSEKFFHSFMQSCIRVFGFQRLAASIPSFYPLIKLLT